MNNSSYFSAAEQMIYELESAMKNNTADRKLLDKLQDKLNTINEQVKGGPTENGDQHKLFELQALIFAIEGKAAESDKYVTQAIYSAGGSDKLSSGFIKNYINDHTNERNPQSQITNKQVWYLKPLGVLISLVSIAVVYGLINLVFVGGQKAIHHGDQSKLETLKTELTAEKSQLDRLESTITDQETYLTNTKKQMDTYKASGQMSTFNGLVDPYNTTYDAYKVNIDDYNSRFPVYNAKVDEANKLAKSVGSTYYIVPVPTGKRSH